MQNGEGCVTLRAFSYAQQCKLYQVLLMVAGKLALFVKSLVYLALNCMKWYTYGRCSKKVAYLIHWQHSNTCFLPLIKASCQSLAGRPMSYPLHVSGVFKRISFTAKTVIPQPLPISAIQSADEQHLSIPGVDIY